MASIGFRRRTNCSTLSAALGQEGKCIPKIPYIFAYRSRWLALLLGRFRLDVMTCMSVYMDIASAIDPQPASQINCKRPIREYALNQKKLIAKIEQVLTRYNLDPHLCEQAQRADDIRCKHV